MARVTIEKVAERAGVSVATVSRALRGLPNVSPATRDRVVRVAEMLNYRPDPNAARLAAGRTRTIAVGVVSIPIWYTGQVVAGIEAVLTSHGYDLTLLLVADDLMRSRALGDVGGGVSKRADGAIIVDLVPTEPERRLLEEQRLPWVMVGADCPTIDSVLIDEVQGATAAARHLIDLGHTSIGLISGGPSVFEASSLPLRREGFLQAIGDAGLRFDPRFERVGDFSSLGGYEAMRTILSSPDHPTAVFAMSDEMAMGAMRACHERGLAVPGDVSVVGFDDVDWAFAVGLTTVRQDVVQLGAVAARLMIDRLEGSRSERRLVTLPTELIVRDSTAAPN
ncbi:MAG TPA: LacI family DNA-binding transcriptional regulator [Acidimicrobiia bacterium]|nr:LacI family DNA-binding transcriptional regulator [Acidimicrobiia bacterium]